MQLEFKFYLDQLILYCGNSIEYCANFFYSTTLFNQTSINRNCQSTRPIQDKHFLFYKNNYAVPREQCTKISKKIRLKNTIGFLLLFYTKQIAFWCDFKPKPGIPAPLLFRNISLTNFYSETAMEYQGELNVATIKCSLLDQCLCLKFVFFVIYSQLRGLVTKRREQSAIQRSGCRAGL